MEINNCEQYVLAELESAMAENDRLRGEVERLSVHVSLLEEQRGPSAIEKAVMEKGRERLFDNCTMSLSNVETDENGNPVPFKDWCLDKLHTSWLPDGIGKATFCDFFEPEFREAYDEALNRINGGDEE